MAKLRSPNVDWIDEARRLSDALASIRVGPIERLARLRLPIPWDTEDFTVLHLIVKVSIRLAYDLQITHKAKANTRSDKGRVAFMKIYRSENLSVIELKNALEGATGVVLRPADLIAAEVLVELREIQTCGCASDKSTRMLPIMVASLGGRFAAETSKLNAGGSRNRKPNDLKNAKSEVLKDDPFLTWKQILSSLEGDGIVQKWDDKRISWMDDKGNTQVTSVGTFRNW